METNRRKVRLICYKECFIEDLEEGNLFQLEPKNAQDNPNIDPASLHRVSISTKNLSQNPNSDKIEAEAVVISTRHSTKIRIENIQNLMRDND